MCKTQLLVSDDLCQLTERPRTEPIRQQTIAQQTISQQSSVTLDGAELALPSHQTGTSLRARRKKTSGSRMRNLIVVGGLVLVLGGSLAMFGLSALRPPRVMLLPIEDQTINSDQTFTYKPEVRAPEQLDGRLVYSLSGAPPSLTINPHTGLMRYTPSVKPLGATSYTIALNAAIEGAPERND
jgi:hypothetical protein